MGLHIDLVVELLLSSLSGPESLKFFNGYFASLACKTRQHKISGMRYFLLTLHMQGNVIDGAKCNLDAKLFCDCKCNAFFASDERSRTLANH